MSAPHAAAGNAADSPATAPLVEARNVSLRVGGRTILEGIDLALAPAEIVTVIGPNGAGKTTLLRVLLGVLRPSAGRVERRAGLRVGYVPQRLEVDPILPLTVRRFLAVGRLASAARIAAALEEVGAGALADAMLHEVSGGEFQRVALARALLRDPDLLILDEPVQGVDVVGQQDIYRLIARLRDERGLAVLLVSHDLHLVMAATDRVICLDRHVCCSGHPEAVVQQPAYLDLFGPRLAEALAVYPHPHHHDHAQPGERTEPTAREARAAPSGTDSG